MIVKEQQLKLDDIEGVFLEVNIEDTGKEPPSERRRVR